MKQHEGEVCGDVAWVKEQRSVKMMMRWKRVDDVWPRWRLGVENERGWSIIWVSECPWTHTEHYNSATIKGEWIFHACMEDARITFYDGCMRRLYASWRLDCVWLQQFYGFPHLSWSGGISLSILIIILRPLLGLPPCFKLSVHTPLERF